MAYPLSDTDLAGLWSSSDWGTQGTYTAADGTPTAGVDVLVSEASEEADDEIGGVEVVVLLEFRKASLPTAPERDATFSDGTNEYLLQSLDSEDEHGTIWRARKT